MILTYITTFGYIYNRLVKGGGVNFQFFQTKCCNILFYTFFMLKLDISYTLILCVIFLIYIESTLDNKYNVNHSGSIHELTHAWIELEENALLQGGKNQIAGTYIIKVCVISFTIHLPLATFKVLLKYRIRVPQNKRINPYSALDRGYLMFKNRDQSRRLSRLNLTPCRE